MKNYRRPVEGIYTRKLEVNRGSAHTQRIERRENIKAIVGMVVIAILYILASNADFNSGLI